MILLIFSVYASTSNIIPDTLLLKSIVIVESGENPKAIHKNRNGTTDYGLGQINTIWVKGLELDTAKLISEPEYNLKWSAYILRHCLDKYGWSWEGLAHYHNSKAIYGLKYMLQVKEVYNKLLSDSKNIRLNPTLHGSLFVYLGEKNRPQKPSRIRIISNNDR